MTHDKIKSLIGESIFNHINSLNTEQLNNHKDALLSEIKMESSKTERGFKLTKELELINYRLS